MVVARLRALAAPSVPLSSGGPGIGHSVPVVEPSVPITLKMPGNIVRDLRAYSVTSGLTLGEIVTRAVTAFLATVRRRG